VATVRSFLAFCQRRRWLAEDLTVNLERRPELADRTKAIPLGVVLTGCAQPALLLPAPVVPVPVGAPRSSSSLRFW
jgi:hypothetical protein